MRFSNVRLLTGDLDATYRFWRDVMGLTVAFGPDSPGGVPNYAYLTVGDVGVELMRPDDFATALGAPTPAAVPEGTARSTRTIPDSPVASVNCFGSTTLTNL